MPYCRLSRARYHYRCAKCEAEVRKGQRYFRGFGHEFEVLRIEWDPQWQPTNGMAREDVDEALDHSRYV